MWLIKGAKYAAKVTIHTIRYGFQRTSFYLQKALNGQLAFSETPTIAGPTEAKISIVFHAYHKDLAEQIFPWIDTFASKTKLPVHLIVTTPSENSALMGKLAESANYTSEIVVVKNHGRDVWPFLQVCQSGVLSNSALVLKIHTKAPRSIALRVNLTVESVHELLDYRLVPGLLKQSQLNNQFVATFRRYVGRTSSWGKNIGTFFEVMEKLQLKNAPGKLRFPAGTIFWTTGAFAQKLGSLDIASTDFKGEPSPDDGALEHALERLFGMIAKDNGGVIPLEKLVTGGQNADRNPRN